MSKVVNVASVGQFDDILDYVLEEFSTSIVESASVSTTNHFVHLDMHEHMTIGSDMVDQMVVNANYLDAKKNTISENVD